MINFFVTWEHKYTVTSFLRTWSNRVGDIFRIVPYEYLSTIKGIQPGAFIFSDIDRLRPKQVRDVERFCDLIATEFDPSLILNHPRGLLQRRELLQTLWEKGINQFRVFPFDHQGDHICYPAFMRFANQHNGPASGLLRNADERRLAAEKLLSSTDGDITQAIIIEFCDTVGADGLYRKYSAFRIGDKIVPGHVLFSSNWITKDSPPEPLREEEQSYLAENPHREELRQIFDLAGITYGRIDYGLRAGKIQVWEININPTLIQKQEKYATDKLALKQQLVDQLSDAFLDVHSRANSIPPRKVSPPAGLLPIIGFRPRTRLRRLLFRRTL